MTRTRLNDQQLEVLRWISRGCPDGEQTGTSYKLSAQALQSRRLAKVSRRQGRWAAETTVDGQYYLEHGDYPPETGRARAVHAVSATAKAPTARPPQNRTPSSTNDLSPRARPTSSKPASRTMPQPNKGDLLIAELIAAGGRIVVQREYRAGGPNWPARIASAARSKQLPADKYIAYGWCQGGIEIVLKDIPAWRTEALAPIAVSERLTNPLPAVTSVRDGNRLLPLTKAALPRALRLLQALFTECERRGYKVKLIPDGRPQYKRGRLQLTDQFTVQPPEVTVGVAVSQQNDRVEHVPTAAELAQSAKNSWVKIPRYDYVPSTRLSIRLTGGQVHRQMEWSDSKDAALDNVLRQMVQEMELRSAAAVAKRKADEEAATLKRQRWEAAVAQARLTYREAFRAKALRQQIADWQKALEVREFLNHAADAVTGMASGADRNAAEAWLAWIAGYAERLDPLAGPLRMPHIPEPRPKDLEPHLDGWSPYAP